ncbi:hypothetical protein SAMN02983003_0705 [Devosia enhydra]|uniref:Uncharacterized protein n=2 Tax=Devosia enhydra TaxID=665118 RepID=A0A1K2HVI8_9HYPH|nr:hypothetical protein SAMN02983003_0705 [Devosia enhydra]
MDWMKELDERGRIAKQLVTDVPPALNSPAMTHDQAVAIYQGLEKHAQAADALLQDIEDDDQPDEVIAAAEALADIYSDLAAAAVERMAELRRKR